MSSFRKLQRLSATERRLLSQALVLLPLTFCGVYALGVSRWHRFLAQLASLGRTSNRSSNHTGSNAPETPLVIADARVSEQAKAIARMVKIASEQGILEAMCLQQTLVLWCLLRRNNIESEIRFGARKEGGELQAHAWVEIDGFALNEESDVCLHFSPLESGVGTGLAPEMPTLN
ncbi:MAG TPA: lasso peptide biosynthesis B2 protein [Pyrinomonadaceae bacterium]